MQLERITLRQISMPLVHFFETSFGRTTERHMVLVEVEVAEASVSTSATSIPASRTARSSGAEATPRSMRSRSR